MTNRPLTLDLSLESKMSQSLVALYLFDTHVQGLSRRDKVGILDCPGFFKHNDAVREILAQPDQPGTSLGGGFEHENPRQHRKLGKVVRQVLFRERNILDCREFGVWLKRADPIQKPKSHGRISKDQPMAVVDWVG